MFFFGEDSVADNLSPYIDAAPKPEQKYFLASQQVDEARHAVFFHRFFSEVIGAGDSISSTLAYTEPQLNWGYRGVFDRLDRMADDLRRDRSLPNFARGIALYHMVVEATLPSPVSTTSRTTSPARGPCPGSARGWRTSHATSSATSASGSRCSPSASPSRRSARRRSPSCCASCSPTRSPCSRRPTGTASTPAATASSSRTSSPSACGRCRPSGGRRATRSRRWRACCRSIRSSTSRRSRGASSSCSKRA